MPQPARRTSSGNVSAWAVRQGLERGHQPGLPRLRHELDDRDVPDVTRRSSRRYHLTGPDVDRLDALAVVAAGHPHRGCSRFGEVDARYLQVYCGVPFLPEPEGGVVPHRLDG